MILASFTPLTTTYAAGPQGLRCGTYEVTKNAVIVGTSFPKGRYEIHAIAVLCSKVLGSKGFFAQFLKLKANAALPKPWTVRVKADGAPLFSSAPGVGFRVQLISSTPTPTPTPTPKPTVDNAVAEKLAAERAAAMKLAAEKAAAYRATLLQCPTNGKCVVGNIGPGGGIVFYVASTPQPWGQYLEVAPANWAGDYVDPYQPWCTTSNSLLAAFFNEPEAVKKNSSKIGSGKTNTELMLSTCVTGIANSVRSYRGGGKTDWYLPSQDELSEMLKNSAVIADFSISSYWSSTLAPIYGDWDQIIFGGTNYTSDETSAGSVRPIRAFG